jgi:hypothetical protein
LSQEYIYEGVPPEAVTVAVPVCSPKQRTFDVAILVEMGEGSLIVTVILPVQVPPTVTFTE